MASSPSSRSRMPRTLRRALRRARRPRVLQVVLSATVVVVFAVVVLAVHRSAGLGQTEVARLAAPSDQSAAVAVSVIGDSFAEGASTSDAPGANWASLVAGDRGWALANTSVGGTGYVIAVPGTQPYQVAQLAEATANDPRLVIVEGSRNDAEAPPESVSAAASALYQGIRAGAPDARLVVVGPIWSDGNAPQPVLATRDAVRSAATAAGAVWIDPIAENWFGARTDAAGAVLIGPDNVHPTLAGQTLMAQRIEADLDAAKQ